MRFFRHLSIVAIILMIAFYLILLVDIMLSIFKTTIVLLTTENVSLNLNLSYKPMSNDYKVPKASSNNIAKQ